MSNQNPSLDAFLAEISSRDFIEVSPAGTKEELKRQAVVPKPDVKERLTQEIAQMTGIQSKQFGEDTGYPPIERWVSAKLGEFARETRVAVKEICDLLRDNTAKTFEVAFHNEPQHPNPWGDRVLFKVRYNRADERAASAAAIASVLGH